ncbi:MAG: hypothetical protein RMM53_00335 [Bacteroidia bacterium]|nr:hypothetical protein [Bacteroidia bacterium]MDW8332641.1 hypothetical protein [Bacteroidia bacterium]
MIKQPHNGREGQNRHTAKVAIVAGAFYGIFIVAALTGCKSFQGAQLSVTPNPLEVHADSLAFTARASIEPKSKLKKKGIYEGKLQLRDSVNNKTFPITGIVISGEKFPNWKKEGARTSVSPKVAYQDAMDGTKLISVNGYDKGKKHKDLPPTTLAPCCITTSRLYCGAAPGEDQVAFYFAGVEYETRKPITLTAKFQFPQNVFEIQPTDFENQEIKAIGEFLSKKYSATKVYIEGFASPEGTVRRNRFLSVERSKQVRAWLVQQLRERGYKSYLDSSFFEIRTTTEDWEGFKNNLDKTNYSEDVKRQIIAIISGGFEEDVKERKVMALVGGAVQVENILAPLRRATIKLEGATSAHSDEQLKAFTDNLIAGKVAPDSARKFYVRPEEMLYTIKSVYTKDDDRKKAVEAFTKVYPDDHRGYNDLGAFMILEGKYDEADRLLSTAKSKKDGEAIVMTNTGALKIRQGKYDEALSTLQAAYAAKQMPEAAFNAGIVHLKRAEYSRAAEMFDAAGNIRCGRYNAALAKLLLNDLGSAKADLDASIKAQADYALNYYLLAILGARTEDPSVILPNIKEASRLKSELGRKALKDLEFRRYNQNDDFKAAVKQ